MTDTFVSAPVLGPNGYVVPSEKAILAGRLADFNAAFGGALNLALSTPQGQLASSDAAIIADAYDQFLFLSQQFDPALAEGRYQDGLYNIYGIVRAPARPTTVTGRCYGATGANIPALALARATDGNIYIAVAGGTIGAGGYVDLTFTCQATGPIACPAGSLNQVYQSIPGWDSVNNPADGVLGNDVEGRAAFYTRYQQSVAINAVGSLPAIQAAVLAVPNVLDAYVVDNPTAAPVTIGGYTLAANSLYVAAVGGDPNAVAKAIWQKKAPGCAYNGNTSITVLDTSPGYSPPYPSYTVQFQTPAALPIKFAVVIKNQANVPPDYATQIQNAIINAFAGGDGGPRVRIGSEVFASRFYAPVAAIGSWVQIVSILVGTTVPANQNDLTINIDKAPTVASSDITVTLGS